MCSSVPSGAARSEVAFVWFRVAAHDAPQGHEIRFSGAFHVRRGCLECWKAKQRACKNLQLPFEAAFDRSPLAYTEPPWRRLLTEVARLLDDTIVQQPQYGKAAAKSHEFADGLAATLLPLLAGHFGSSPGRC